MNTKKTLLTTTIGAYPKPHYIKSSGWFSQGQLIPTREYLVEKNSPQEEVLYRRGIEEVVCEQVDIGIDIPSEGEIRRENYIYYHCRHLLGFDFAKLTQKTMRNGSWIADVPTITGKVKAKEPFLLEDWQYAQKMTDKPIKMTIPGPLTIIDSTYNKYYDDEKALAIELANALNREIYSLAEAGCKWIQIDEPVLARYPHKALDYGIECLERCFYNISPLVNRVVHICCGYPDILDNEEFLKADPDSYLSMAPHLESAAIDIVALEDAHRHNDLKILEQFKTTKIILGTIAIARSRIESQEEIRQRLLLALEHIDANRLLVAPDCGLLMLDRKTVVAKLTNMVAAAKSI